jgi:hypothetical protein
MFVGRRQVLASALLIVTLFDSVSRWRSCLKVRNLSDSPARIQVEKAGWQIKS